MLPPRFVIHFDPFTLLHDAKAIRHLHICLFRFVPNMRHIGLRRAEHYKIQQFCVLRSCVGNAPLCIAVHG